MQFPARNAIFLFLACIWFSASEARVDGKVAPSDAVPSLAANGASATRLLVGKSTVDGEGAGAPDHDDQGDGERENVVLKAFALLVAEPVCKKAVVPMAMATATIMLQAMPKAAARSRKPRIKPMLPKNSAQMARKAKGAGICRP